MFLSATGVPVQEFSAPTLIKLSAAPLLLGLLGLVRRKEGRDGWRGEVLAGLHPPRPSSLLPHLRRIALRRRLLAAAAAAAMEVR
ncbi:hypothetical protein GQ607_000507 [Colletotrichum asianum]|uniref:Uncharacterized protein n=1 Tax=Colletotrichum asianum TaxID=702518 RepID=A0A8H3WPV9_9PEZI|nr:hypothetical protein GQ607_000507 [Colletotrichum asianum]